jgi:hypothetical protein
MACRARRDGGASRSGPRARCGSRDEPTLLPELIDGLRIVRIAELYDSMIEEENFYLYRVRPAFSASPRNASGPIPMRLSVTRRSTRTADDSVVSAPERRKRARGAVVLRKMGSPMGRTSIPVVR